MNETTTTDACGTARGYRRHRRHRETPCGPCQRGNSETSIASRIDSGVQDTVLVDVRALGRLLHNADPRTLQQVHQLISPRIGDACTSRFLRR